jgi:hypothetical protein
LHHIDSKFGTRRCLIGDFAVVQLDAEQTGHKVIGVGLLELLDIELEKVISFSVMGSLRLWRSLFTITVWAGRITLVLIVTFRT